MKLSKVNILKFIIGASIIAIPFLSNWYSTIRTDQNSLLSPLQIIRGGTLILLIAILGSSFKQLNIQKLMLGPLLWMIFILVVLAIPQSSIAGNLVEAFQLAYISIFLFCGYYISQYDKSLENWLYNIGLVMLVSTIALQIYGYSIGSTSYRSEFGLAGLGDRASVTARILNVIILILLIKIRDYKLKHWLILAIAFISLTFTLRRGSLIGAVLSLIAIITVMLFYDRTTKKTLRIAFSFTTVFAIGIFIIFNSPVYVELLTRMEGINIAAGGTGSGRLNFWAAGLQSGIDRPFIEILFGEGVGNVSRAIGRNFFIDITAHNLWLSYFISLGFIGLLLILYWHFKLIYLCKKINIKYKPILIASLISILFVGFTDGSILNPTWSPVYFLIGIIVQKSNYEITR